jgi:3-dehydroquinate synthase
VRQISVSLPDGRTSPVAVGHQSLDGLGARCRELELGRHCALIGDEALLDSFVGQVETSLQAAGFEVLVLPYGAGEQGKNLTSVEELVGGMLGAELDRGAWVAAVGGGVVGDLAGFVAASYLRGVDVVQVPTTIVSQVDASIGGKTAVNHRLGKNLIGAFHQPRLVWADTDCLRTLPRAEIVAGMAEVVKHGIIRDPELFAFLEERLTDVVEMRIDADELDWLIARNAQIKADVVSADEREGGLRAILNYGHTVGHAIEAATAYRRYRHGEAVLLGMAAAGEIAARLRMWDSSAARSRHDALVERLGLPPGIADVDAGHIVERTRADKKRIDAKSRFILARDIGRVEVVEGVDDAIVRDAVDYLQNTYE